ncbi:MAG: hypothetical protein ACP5XB_29835 [Isosphaeraceae bacterium]
MRLRRICLVVLGCVIVVPLLRALAQEGPASRTAARIAYDLRATITENIRSTQAEDLEAMMKTIHSKSPLSQPTRQQVSQIFGKVTGLKYELVSLKFLTVDEEYALARIRQRTTKIPIENFRNNEIDMIMAFKREGGAWKIWNQAILEIKYLND